MKCTDTIERIRKLDPDHPETINFELEASRYALELNRVEQLGCSFSQLSVERISPKELSNEELQDWGAQLGSRVTYLVESIEPIEHDKANGVLLCRSSPPESKENDKLFFEILLHKNGAQQWTRKRFSDPDKAVCNEPIHMTYEVLEKLIHDLA